jgi:hypothetical protein
MAMARGDRKHHAKHGRGDTAWWFWVPLVLPVAFVGLGKRRPQAERIDSRPNWSPLLPLANRIDWQLGWHRLPWPLGLAMVVALRRQLRRDNLHDPSQVVPSLPRPAPVPEGTSHHTARTADGTFNDLSRPDMGSVGTRFGRNVPIRAIFVESEAEVLTPNPRLVSRYLLTRETFQPATTLNVLAAAWIQFMIRDWFSHGPGPQENPWQVPLATDDPWPRSARPMTILRTPADPTRPTDADGALPTHINYESHWWDASQIYGSNADYQRRARTGVAGKLRVDESGFPAVEVDPLSPKHPADVPGFWIGLALLQTLFTLEHNAICDRLRDEYPEWSDEEIFARARLINAALLAKIHTVEWTPAIISHPTTQRAMRLNWWGLAGERASRLVGRLGESDLVSGAVGSRRQHFGVPYALTEEFVAVYRMHPLIPDDYAFRSANDHRLLLERDFHGVAQRSAMDVLGQVALTDLFYSFGVAHPGAITLHNFPRGLQEFRRPDGHMQDLAATDILRARELAVPRYNAFRELVHLRPVRSFTELTDNPVWAEELRWVYDGDIDRVDLMAGMFAEPKPAGLGFSDTAFRIFVLMAPRRLKSDRFFTTDFTPQVYTQTGLDWIADNDMSTVLLRHFPELRPALRGVSNAFTPWSTAEA